MSNQISIYYISKVTGINAATIRLNIKYLLENMPGLKEEIMKK